MYIKFKKNPAPSFFKKMFKVDLFLETLRQKNPLNKAYNILQS